MDMDGWRDILHFDFYGEHVLFPSLRLSSAFNFLLASILTVTLCALERHVYKSPFAPCNSHNVDYAD